MGLAFEQFWPRSGDQVEGHLRDEQDRLAREQVQRVVDGLQLVPPNEIVTLKKLVGNDLNLTAGDRPLPDVDRVDTVVRSVAGRTVVSAPITVSEDSMFAGLHFASDDDVPLVHIANGATATFHDCWFDRGPKSQSNWLRFSDSAQGICVGCWFVGDSTPAVVILNGGVAGLVEVVGCYKRSAVAWGTVNTTAVL